MATGQLDVGSINATGVITCTTPATGSLGGLDIMGTTGNCRIRFMTTPTTSLCVVNATTNNATFNGNVTAFSDERLKENIEPIDDPLQKVLSIRGVTFTRNDFSDKTKKHIGVIAQEIEKVLPEVVYICPEEDSEGNPIEVKTVAYGNMVSILIEAIKEQNKEIQDLKDRVKILESK